MGGGRNALAAGARHVANGVGHPVPTAPRGFSGRHCLGVGAHLARHRRAPPLATSGCGWRIQPKTARPHCTSHRGCSTVNPCKLAQGSIRDLGKHVDPSTCSPWTRRTFDKPPQVALWVAATMGRRRTRGQRQSHGHPRHEFSPNARPGIPPVPVLAGTSTPHLEASRNTRFGYGGARGAWHGLPSPSAWDGGSARGGAWAQCSP